MWAYMIGLSSAVIKFAHRDPFSQIGTVRIFAGTPPGNGINFEKSLAGEIYIIEPKIFKLLKDFCKNSETLLALPQIYRGAVHCVISEAATGVWLSAIASVILWQLNK